MNLLSIAEIVGAAPPPGGAAELDIDGLAYNSREVRTGDLFICRQGGRVDSHLYAGEAVARGAVALLCERRLGAGVPELVVSDSRAAMNRLASPFYGNPSFELGLAGVTGTNGKTTVTFMLESIFRLAGDPAGMIGTVESRVAGRVYPAARTTPESTDIQRLLREMVDKGVRRCAMEVTSIGIDGGRVEGTKFEVAVFTNLTHDHLDHHLTMESYFNSKLRLFTEIAPGSAVVNIDDSYGRRIADRAVAPVTTYSVQGPADLCAREVVFGPAGAQFVAIAAGSEQPVNLSLSGRFNVSNALAAIGAARAMGIDIEVAAQGIAELTHVPGRFEPVREGQDFLVFVDYAHTPDGLENVLRAAGDLGGSRVIAVFGCGGDRDRAKRPLMGEIAARHAGLVFVTSDNPRNEDPSAILLGIEEGIRPAPPAGGYEIIEDREAAIRAALAAARPGDVVVIAGKGHESGQEKAGRVTPFDDREVAARALRELR